MPRRPPRSGSVRGRPIGLRGRLLVSSISTRDFPVIQALVLIIALCTVFASLLTDLAYGLLDPRIRFR